MQVWCNYILERFEEERFGTEPNLDAALNISLKTLLDFPCFKLV